MTKSSSWVATILVPSGEKKASSGTLNVSPGARSPDWGYCQSSCPLGATTSRRLFALSAMRIGPGRTDGSEPGWRKEGPVAPPIHQGRPTAGAGKLAAELAGG